MKVVKLFVRVLVLAMVFAAFAGFPVCWVALKAQGLVWGLLATLLLGRFFCEAICPLGTVQSFVNWICHPKTHVRRVCTRLPETKAQRIVRWSVVALFAVLAACGCMGPATMIVPISVFGKAAALWWPGVAVFGIVVALAAIGDGRWWCNWICPFGTLYNLVAKVTPCKNKVGKGCGNCRKCFENRVNRVGEGSDGVDKDVKGLVDAKDPIGAKDPVDAKDPNGVTRRETLKGVAVLAVAEKINDGGFAEVSLPGVPERGTPVLPPGAGDRETFYLKCASCQLCIANCPGKCLVQSTSLKTFGQPVMDFRRGYCLGTCVKCGEICPELAIKKLQLVQRPNVHMGEAAWAKDRCLRTTEKEECTACVRKCPVQAIHLVQGFPVVDRQKCIGCGACEHVCPARPLPAIYVKGFERQRVVNPITEADLLKEMKAKLDAGASVVVARGGVIIATEEGRGIDPLLKLFDAGKLSGAVVMDKVVGRAAAAICAEGGAAKVCASLASKDVAGLFERRGIPFAAEKTVEAILNREQTGSCPMEKAVSGLDEPKKMIEAIRKAMRK